MTDYLLIESNEPFESTRVQRNFELAGSLARGGSNVTLFLVQNGVLPARASAGAAGAEPLKKALGDGVEVLADQFSLRERGMSGAALTPGVRSAPLDTVVDHLAAGRKAIWL